MTGSISKSRSALAYALVVLAVVLSTLAASAAATQTQAGQQQETPVNQLQAGAARVVITPTIGTWQWRNVHDDLYAKALVLKSGDTSIALVVCDVGSVAKDDMDKAKALAEEITGIPAANIMVAATHTHYAPFSGRRGEEANEFADWLIKRVADSIKCAQERLQPAMIGSGSGAAPGEVFNRRYWMKDGTVVFNPLDVRYHNDDGTATQVYQQSDIVRPAGPTDPQVGVLVVLAEDRTPIAVLANYALHYVSAPDYSEISANYFGAFDRALQRMAGADFVGILLNGTCGDINNEDYMGQRDSLPYEYYAVDRVADVLASEVYRVWRGLRLAEYQAEVPLAVANDPFTLRHRSYTPEQIAAAKQVLDGPDTNSFGTPEWLDRVKSRMVVRASDAGESRQTQVQAFRIGDLGLATLPSEIFVEIGMEIKQRSPFEITMVASLANDSFGYFPTDKAVAEGSYETLNSLCAVGSAPAIVNSAVGLLDQLAD